MMSSIGTLCELFDPDINQFQDPLKQQGYHVKMAAFVEQPFTSCTKKCYSSCF